MPPRKRDEEKFRRLFVRRSIEHKNPRFAAIPWGRDGSASVYSSGYFQAAQVLAERLAGNEREGTALIYPLMQNLRHSIELQLKEIISGGRELKYVATTEEWLWSTHDLEALANEVNVVMTKGDGSIACWAATRDFLREWEAADPSGSFFRYPRERGGALIPVDGNIDVFDFLEAIAPVRDCLLSIEAWIDAYLGFKQEMDADARAEAERAMAGFADGGA